MDIIAANKLSEHEIKKYAKGRRGFISFSKDVENTETLSKTLELHGFERVDLREIIVALRSELRKTVVEFSGNLNHQAPHRNWWALGLSRRIAMYPFFDGMAKLFVMRRIIDMGKWDTLIVLDNSISPWDYIKDITHQIRVNIQTRFSIADDWKYRIKRILPASMLLWLIRKIVIKIMIGSRTIKMNDINPSFVLFTLIDKNNFVKKGTFRDVYLGDLSSYFKAEKYDTFTMGQLHDNPSRSLSFNIRNMSEQSFALLDHFWSLRDLYIVTKDALRAYFSKPPYWPQSYFAGFDVRGVLNANLKWELQSCYADNLLNYRAAKMCLEQIQPRLFIYPYENKCIEHMLLMAIQEVSPVTKTIGYQHAVLTAKHIHMFLAEGESDTLPLPTKIVTNGRYTANLLHEYGNYPEGIIVAGTALRQTSLIPGKFIKAKPPKKVIKVLMALAEGKEEYDKAIEFMRNIQTNDRTQDYNFRVRLHPGVPYDPLENEKIMKGLRCTKDTNPSLLEALYWADVVLYASTSVAVQAMMMGIPVIWMDLLDFWGADPINKDDVLQWKLDSAEGWNHVITTIEQLSCDEFGQRMENTKRFVSDYFCYEPFDIKRWLKYA
ncbi:MAG: hypothetical protein M1147_01105 [Nitrospirae bacterium]|nr:hypothetical protein [Nitrospirota bacterium]MCL5976707.1 hypothetical protein [Nitrospirota bacterium]